MQAQGTRDKPGQFYTTGTPGVYRRSGSYVVKWNEEGKTRMRTMPTYEAACAFRRDFVLPYRHRRALPPTTAMPRRRDLGWIYFFQAGGEEGFVKIGWSRDPGRRLSELGCSNPGGIELLALLPGSRALEARLHAKFAHLRVSGEWFSRHVLDEVWRLLSLGLAEVDV